MKFVRITVVIVILFLGLVWIVHDQVASHDVLITIDRLAIQQVDGNLRVYNVDDGGHFTFLIELDDFGFRGVYYVDQPRRQILSPTSVVISPDGQRFAFTAVDPTKPVTASLFIYTLGESELRQVFIPGLATLRWSPRAPNVDAILISEPDPALVVEDVIRLAGLYVYNLTRDDLTKATVTDYYYESRAFNWMPDGQRVIAPRESDNCDSPCFRATDLHIFDFGHSSDRPFTILNDQLPRESLYDARLTSCRSQRAVWSADNERFYYIVRCGQSSFSRDLLYSTDLHGNNRLEANFLSAYPDDESAYIDAVFPPTSKHDLIVVTSGQLRYQVRERPDFYTWRVYRVRSADEWEMVAHDTESADFISASKLSPDGRWVALGGNNPYVTLIDVATGRTTFRNGFSNIFRLEWVDNMHLLVIESLGDYWSNPMDTWLLDITTGERVNLTEDMEGRVWIIPTQDTPSFTLFR